MSLYNMDTHHTTNYLEILMLCAKLWAYLLVWSPFSPILDKKEVKCPWQQNKEWSGKKVSEITKGQPFHSLIKQFKMSCKQNNTL